MHNPRELMFLIVVYKNCSRTGVSLECSSFREKTQTRLCLGHRTPKPSGQELLDVWHRCQPRNFKAHTVWCRFFVEEVGEAAGKAAGRWSRCGPTKSHAVSADVLS